MMIYPQKVPHHLHLRTIMAASAVTAILLIGLREIPWIYIPLGTVAALALVRTGIKRRYLIARLGQAANQHDARLFLESFALVLRNAALVCAMGVAGFASYRLCDWTDPTDTPLYIFAAVMAWVVVCVLIPLFGNWQAWRGQGLIAFCLVVAFSGGCAALCIAACAMTFFGPVAIGLAIAPGGAAAALGSLALCILWGK
jgi:hypothetical protein